MKTEESIRQFITNFNIDQTKIWMKHDNSAFNKHWSQYYKNDNVVMIRPSGNPANKDTFNSMMMNSDIVFESGELLSIESIDIFAQEIAAVVTYKRHDKFTYKGTPNNDISMFTATLDKINGDWKIIFGTRSTGEKPSE